MSIFSYVIANASGFAPNPYGGYLTLATCKPVIRRTARPGDWVVGTVSARHQGAGRLVYAALVDEVVSLEEYGRSPRFATKIPKVTGPAWAGHGDNIYVRDSAGHWRQRRNPHHGPEAMTRDLSGRNVIIAHEFWYFGERAPRPPSALAALVKKGPGHKRCDDDRLEVLLRRWLRSRPASGVLRGGRSTSGQGCGGSRSRERRSALTTHGSPA